MTTPADELRDRIAQALAAELMPRYGGPQHRTPGGLPLTATAEEAALHRAQPLADAVLAVLGTTGEQPKTEGFREWLGRQHVAGTGIGVQPEATPLTAAERQFLTFALDQAADEMSLADGFTDEDDAALEKFRRMATATEEPTA